MKIAIAGGSGFVGSHLVRYFTAKNVDVILISRSERKETDGRTTTLTWGQLDDHRDELENLDALINLAGETINQRWTPAAKERIKRSRLDTTSKLAEITNALAQKPKVVINGSAIDIYGTSKTETFDERSLTRGTGFLSGVVEQWENTADLFQSTRLVKLRTGLVLGKDGGAFPNMLLPYKLGVGGRLGSGRQWLSWIHIKDMVRLIEYCIQQGTISGPVNATAPHPVTNEQFGRTLAKTLHRPHWFPVPAFLLQALLGELAHLLLDGQKVIPKVLSDHGFVFAYPTTEEALKDLTANHSLG